MKFNTRAALAALTIVGALLAGTQPAAADAEIQCSPGAGVACPHYEIIDVKRTGGHVDKLKPIASCTVGSGGGACTITSCKTVTRTVGVRLGVDVGFVKSQLSISQADAELTSVSCTSPVLSTGQTWATWGMGNKFEYKVKRWYATPIGETIPEISTEHRAFDPDGTQTYCGVL